MGNTKAEPRVTGAIVKGHLDLLNERFGAAAVASALAALPPEHRAEMESVTAASFVPIPAYEAFYDQVARIVGRATPELHVEMSRLSVDRTFRTIWRVLLRFTSDEALISRTPMLFTRGYDRGKLSARFDTPGTADIALTEWPDVPDIALRGLSVAIETVLRLSGRRTPSVTWQRARDGATLRATWK